MKLLLLSLFENSARWQLQINQPNTKQLDSMQQLNKKQKPCSAKTKPCPNLNLSNCFCGSQS
jgi:hypothetical protein